jgi:hypothetical protein
MKRARRAITMMAAMGSMLSGWGCGAEAATKAPPADDMNMDEASAADAGGEPPSLHDAGTDPGMDPPEDCSAFTPLAADVAFMATGWMGDAPTSVLFVDCTGPRASQAALGNCHQITYTPPMASPTTMGWAGINWQNPQGYWDDPPEPFVGYPMPCGATKISFYARGEKGGESVDFWGGNKAYQARLDKVVLTKEWKQYSMPFTGMPDGNVTVGFGWAMGGDLAAAGGKAVFYLDDIKWE